MTHSEALSHFETSFYNSAITKPVVCARIAVNMGSHLAKRVPVKSHNSFLDQRSRKVIVCFHRNHFCTMLRTHPVSHKNQSPLKHHSFLVLVCEPRTVLGEILPRARLPDARTGIFRQQNPPGKKTDRCKRAQKQQHSLRLKKSSRTG